MSEQLVNQAITTLAADITAVATSLTVSSASGFPASGNFRLRIGDELLLATAVSGTTFTVTRAIENTSAAAHLSGDRVACVLTAGGLAQYVADNGGNSLYVAPVLADFTIVNQGVATITQSGSMILLNEAASTGDNLRILVQSVPASTPWEAICFLTNSSPAVNYESAGMCLRDSSSGSLVTFPLRTDGTGPVYSWALVEKWTDPTTYNSQYLNLNLPQREGWWLKIKDDGTNRSFWLSRDKQNWCLILEHLNTDFITPDQVGVFFDVNNNAYAFAGTLLSYEQG